MGARAFLHLPEALSKAMRTDLPATPADLLRAALINELFDTDAFRACWPH